MSAVWGDSASRDRAAQARAAPQRAAAGDVPCVSVVIPTCGRPELLARCVQAVMAQRLPGGPFEVIVVDDGHSEATRTLVKALAGEANEASEAADGVRNAPALRYLRPRHGRGPAVARNTGWQAARGDIVAFTDDDTVPLAGWLAEGVRALQAGDCAAVAGRVQVPPREEPPTDHERMTRGLEATEFVTANAFVKRAALFQVQGFDERFTRAWREDSDLHFRLQDQAGPVGRCEAAVVVHPVRPERWGVSLRQQKNAFFEALLYAKHPQRYRSGAGLPTPWDYYAIVALALLAMGLFIADVMGSAFISAVFALALVLRFAARRLKHTSRRPEHVAEMLLSSALIPFLSVYWRLRGAVHFRVWFL